MFISHLNLLGIIVATVGGMILGAIWYSQALFGNQWMKCLGKTKEALGSSTMPMIGAVIACLLTAIGIDLLHSLMMITSLASAAGLGLLLGFLIIFPAMLSDNLFCGWGHKLLMIQSGYRLASVILMSVLIYLF